MSYTEHTNIKDMQKDSQTILAKPYIEGVFLKDTKKAYAYKKAEKLCQAVHVVLEHCPQKTPVTDRLSILSVQFIHDVLRTDAKSPESATALELVSLLSVARVANLIAPKNAEFLAQEYELLLDSMYEKAMPTLDLDTHVEEVTKTPKAHVTNQVQQISNSKGHKGHSDRKGQVLSIIKDKGTVGIKDIAASITDCSEKTIQRILLSLIEEGVVRKEGERRWSTYSLI